MTLLAFIYAFLFATLYILARRGGPSWRWSDTAVVIWGLSFAAIWVVFFVVATLAVSSVNGPSDKWASWMAIMLLAIGVPGAITAVLVRWSYRDPRPAFWIMGATAGSILFAAAAPVISSIAAAAFWHIITGMALFKFRPRLDPDACRACGYDLRGLPGPTCPECGTPLPPPPSRLRRWGTIVHHG